jgi:hypothetical protein
MIAEHTRGDTMATIAHRILAAAPHPGGASRVVWGLGQG